MLPGCACPTCSPLGESLPGLSTGVIRQRTTEPPAAPELCSCSESVTWSRTARSCSRPIVAISASPRRSTPAISPAGPTPSVVDGDPSGEAPGHAIARAARDLTPSAAPRPRRGVQGIVELTSVQRGSDSGRHWSSGRDDDLDAGRAEGGAERLGWCAVGDEHVDEVQRAQDHGLLVIEL